MKKEIKDLLSSANPDELSWHKIIVSVFVGANSLSVKNNQLIKSLLIKSDDLINAASESLAGNFTFDDLIETFELLVPAGDRVVNGAIYTPNYIKDFIVKHSIKKLKKPLKNIVAADISCGCGAFLYTLAREIKLATQLSFSEIYRNNLFGLDICDSSVMRAKILLSLLALMHGEDKKNFEFNIHCGNALSFNWLKNSTLVAKNCGFDLVVGNPPYVRAKNIDNASKNLLSRWSVTNSGNPDLYIPFFEIGLTYLREGGILGFITVNSFFRSVNARSLRSYFQDNLISLSIIDFGNEKIFTSKSAYTCLCFASKKKSKFISYKKENGSSLVKGGMSGFGKIHYANLDSHGGWLLSDSFVINNITKIEAMGKPLGSLFKIKNGIATLSNKTYIFKPISESKLFYEMEFKGKKYKVEKKICRNIIKPNILKSENELEALMEKLIFPYYIDDGSLKLIDEVVFRKKFPKAYQYLSDSKSELSKRDKGEGGYEKWYAFGRTQALMDRGCKLLFPYMARSPHFVLSDDDELMIYCGYGIFANTIDELKLLKKILQSKVFNYYMINTSKPYSGGYYAYAKNYVKNFGVCNLSKAEKKFLLGTIDQKKIDNFLVKKYAINI
jgi:adenine-specific DNA-methyltransferase